MSLKDEDSSFLESVGERLRWQTQAMEAMVNGIAIADATQPDGPLVYVNPAFERMTGYRAEEVLGTNCRFLQGDDRDQPGIRELRDAVAEGRATKVLIRNYRKNGELFWNEFSISPVRNDAGVVTHFVGIQQDVTELIQTMEALRQAKSDADRANQAKSEFLSRMSHELRTPMNAVLGFAQLLEFDPDLGSEQRENVEEIIRGGRHLLDLINEVLDLAKVESGRVELSPEPVALQGLLQECGALVEPLARERDLEIQIGQALPDHYVHADRVRLKQILINLLSNAIKYNRPQGRVTLDLEPAMEVNSGLRILVSDTGRGIPNERITELFEPFTRLLEDEHKVEGSGIGLAITQRLVHLMGGCLGAVSQVGEGSTFWVELPQSIATDETPGRQAPSGTVESTSGQPGAVRKILQIEDNFANLRLLERLLKRHDDFSVLSTEDPYIGLELAREHCPDVIILDIQLARLDGFKVLERLREAATTRHIPVVALTANATEPDRQRGLAAGFDAYLTKPLNLGELLDTIRNVLSQDRANRPGPKVRQ
ncbi:MAG: ATP-binding protein [Pseudomonadota bacterium]